MAAPETTSELGFGHDGKPLRFGVHGTGITTGPDGKRHRLFHSPFEEGLGGSFLEGSLGPCRTVFHSPLLGCHTYLFPPSEDQNHWKMVSMGLSGFSMPVPAALTGELLSRCELLMCMPSTWVPPAASGLVRSLDDLDESNWAPELLMSMVNYVVDNNALFKHNDGMFGNPLTGQETILADSVLGACMLRAPLHLGEENCFYRGVNPYTLEEEVVRLLMVVPISVAEYQYRREHGTDALWDLLAAASATPHVCDISRSSVV